MQCSFYGKNENAVIARLPNNHGMQYPEAECVLIDCTLYNIPPIGFFPIDEDAKTANLCEYNSNDPLGNPIDVSFRHSYVKQLSKEEAMIYRNYTYVLGENFDIKIE